MKKMKCCLAVLLALCMILCLAACGGPKDNGKEKLADVGYYTVTSVSDGEDAFDAEWLALLGADEWYLELREDGTGTLNMYDEEMKITWKPGSITMDGETMKYTLKGDTLTLTEDGAEIVFTRSTGKPAGGSAQQKNQTEGDGEPAGAEDSQPSGGGTSPVGSAIDGTITASTADLGIVINGTTVSYPWRYTDLVAAGVPDKVGVADYEIGPNTMYSVDVELEDRDYWVTLGYDNESSSSVVFSNTASDSIGLCSWADKPVDQGASIWGVRPGMTQDEVLAMFGTPDWEYSDGYEYIISFSDASDNGKFNVWFNENGLVRSVYLYAD